MSPALSGHFRFERNALIDSFRKRSNLTVFASTFNRPKIFGRMVQSIEAQGVRYDGYVVDNGKKDLLVSVPKGWTRLAREAPFDTFADQINWALQEADPNSDVFVVADSAVLSPKCLRAMLDHDSAGIVGALITAADGMVSSAGGELEEGQPVVVGCGTTPDSHDACRPTLWVSAVAALIRRPVLDSVGYFDRQFSADYEMADFCIRARDAGATTLLCKDARITHGAASTSVSSDMTNAQRWTKKWPGSK